MREQVRIVNEHLARLDLYHRGKKFDIPVVRRIFNGSFDRGGRFYCHGDSFKDMPADERGEIEMFVDGAARPVVEIDYASIHITMAYEEAGARPPAGDKYTIAGFSRRLVKVAVNILFDANRDSGILAVTEELPETPTSAPTTAPRHATDAPAEPSPNAWCKPSNTNTAGSATTSAPTAARDSRRTPTWPCRSCSGLPSGQDAAHYHSTTPPRRRDRRGHPRPDDAGSRRRTRLRPALKDPTGRSPVLPTWSNTP